MRKGTEQDNVCKNIYSRHNTHTHNNEATTLTIEKIVLQKQINSI